MKHCRVKIALQCFLLFLRRISEMKKISTLITLAALLGVTTLTACQPEEMNSNGQPPTNASPNVTHETPATPDSESSQLQADLGNNIVINATVSTHADDMSVFNAEHFSFDTDLLCQLLLGDNSWVDETIPSEGITRYTNGENEIMHIACPHDKNINFSFFPAENNGSANNLIHYAEPTQSDMAFATRESAVQLVQELLQQIGITAELIDISTFDTTVIANAVANAQEGLGEYFQPQYYNTEIPESYLITMRQVSNAIPVYTGGRTQQIVLRQGNDRDIQIGGVEAFIGAIVTADGVVDITVSRAVKQTTVSIETPALISLESAIEVVREHYSNVINTDQIEFTEIELLYTALPKSLTNTTNLELYPTWVFSGTRQRTLTGRDGNSEQHNESFVLFVDAINGQLLEEKFR